MNSIFLIFYINFYFLKEKNQTVNIFYLDLLIHLHLKCTKINIRSFLLIFNATLLLRKDKIIQEENYFRKLRYVVIESRKQKCLSIPRGYAYLVVLQSLFYLKNF